MGSSQTPAYGVVPGLYGQPCQFQEDNVVSRSFSLSRMIMGCQNSTDMLIRGDSHMTHTARSELWATDSPQLIPGLEPQISFVSILTAAPLV